jgi:5-methyltetrahydrofolate--homocysteine methyltransferase
MDMFLSEILDGVVNGDNHLVPEKTNDALEKGISPETLLNEALIPAMAEVGRRFEIGEYFVPEMLVSARAMKSALAILKPKLVKQNYKSNGKIVVGTVKGDLHDIGKNLVALMLEGAGFEVIDAGSDVAPEKFVGIARTNNADIIGLSALLTTTMTNMKTTITALEQAGLKGKIKVMIGGAPVTEGYAKQIGADGYAEDANRAVTLAKQLVNLNSSGA